MKRRDFVSAAAATIAARAAVSQVPNSPLLCLGSACQTGQLTNGSSFTVTGTGFGTKKASAPTVYDNCQGTNITALWNSVWHVAEEGGKATDGWMEQYHLPTDLTPNGDTWGNTSPNIVRPATPFRSKYICSACESAAGGYVSANMWFGHADATLNPSVQPYYIVASWYETIGPGWVFNTPYPGSGETAPGDNNFKWLVYTTEITGGYGTYYWYMEMGNSRFTSLTSTPWTDINDDGAGVVGALKGHNGSEWTSPDMPNKYYNTGNGWVKKELSMYMTPSTNGFVSMTYSVPNYSNPGNAQPRYNNYLWNSSNGSGTTDPYAGAGRAIYIGGFRRNFPIAANRSYWSDVYFDIQTAGCGRFALTDTNSLTTATVCEWQPYTAWSNTSVTLTCSKGNLPSGTVYLWLLDEVNGNRLIGSYTMS